MLVLLTLLPRSALAVESGFVYLPAARSVSTVAVSVDVGARSNGALRFVDPGVGRTGLVQRVEGSWAAQPWLAVGAVGMLSEANPDDAPVSAAGGAWMRVARPEPDGPQIAGQVGGHREFSGGWAITAIAILDVPIGAARLGFAPAVEHRFMEGADAVDIMVPLAVDVGIGDRWRIGAEAIGQDLEAYVEAEEEEAEGGATWLAAGTLSWQAEHAHVALAPGVGVATSGVGFAGRLVAGWDF